MMQAFTSKGPYIKQISIYFSLGSHREAYSLSKEFASQFPKDMISHFLFAKSAFWLNDLKTAREEAFKAFNLSKGNDELAVAGILLACVYYQLREYRKGMDVLNLINAEIPQKEELSKLRFVFALALHDEAAAMKHLESLYEINKKAASNLIVSVLERYS